MGKCLQQILRFSTVTERLFLEKVSANVIIIFLKAVRTTGQILFTVIVLEDSGEIREGKELENVPSGKLQNTR